MELDGASFGSSVILAFYWRRFGFSGADASTVAGAALALIWFYMDGGPSGIWGVYPVTPGFLVALLVAAVVSRLTPEPSEKAQELFDMVNSNKGQLRETSQTSR